MTLLLSRVRWVPLCCSALLLAGGSLGAGTFARQGAEFRMTSPLRGDQVFPHVSLGAGGGYVVWHDNATDGDGTGISARRVDAGLSGVLGVFRVNSVGTADQEKPQVAVLQDGGAAFVWQGGANGKQKIYARFVKPDGTFRSADLQVNTYAGGFQIEPAVATLQDGGAVVVWNSFGQDGSMLGVYGQRFSATGQKVGAEFAVNQYTEFNQRSATVAGLPGGRFLVAWVCESPLGQTVFDTTPTGGYSGSDAGVPLHDVAILARCFSATGEPEGDEFQVSSSAVLAANPAISVAEDGSMLVAYSGRKAQLPVGAQSTDRWDVYGRLLQADGTPLSAEFTINTRLRGDQYAPRLARVGGRFFAVWTTVGQDGSYEGVCGRAVEANGPAGGEVFVNTTTAMQQMHPAVASDAQDACVVTWTSFTGGEGSFDLFAQRVALAPAVPLAAPAAPFAFAVSETELSVTWAEVTGYDIAAYELYIDGATTPVDVQGTHYLAENFMPASQHTFRLAYRLVDGSRSEVSTAATGRTWGLDRNRDGLPDDWQASSWPELTAQPPGKDDDTDGDGASNLAELLAGTNPADPNSVMRLEMKASTQGWWLDWNVQPGGVYQVQVSSNLGSWTDVGAQRFAPGTTDSIPVDGAQSVSMYRVIRIR